MSRTVRWLNGYTSFPVPRQAADEGLLAVGGDLSMQRLLSAYSRGIFPWYNANEPILWWCPNPRMVLFCDELRVARSLGKKCRQIARLEQDKAQREFWVSLDQAFLQVISRSEEHTSELQSRGHLVCRLLLEKKHSEL